MAGDDSLLAEIRAQPTAIPLPGLPDAWHWSPAPGLDFAAALSVDGACVFQVNARDSYDEDLVRALLEAARRNGPRLLAGSTPFRVLPEFDHPGYDFDVLVVARPGVHRYHEVRAPALFEATWAVFPGYSTEFADLGRYADDDAREAFRRFLKPADLRRRPVPFLMARWDNTLTRAGTTGPDAILVGIETVSHEIRLLKGALGSFVEFENRHARVWRIEWNDHWGIRELGRSDLGFRAIGLDDLLAFVTARIAE
ncbi:hypothetical protein OHB33_18945 [Streptomyces sp. NBC_01558]|uniref:hypothetical protein n=1 Tax=Streptomyces sp. NBC_01558 TaxID=2975878 RepID=UPI002DD9996A|nr:hypothetical protein [Streptomyces sp. NBC_01558]WSD78246.1 hypothetical protein OHB33_18945 [Streptomyces sp. NBC_01558]